MFNTAIEREQKLAHWVAAQLTLSNAAITLIPITSDAGFRRYFRFVAPSHSNTQWLAVDAPPQTEDSRQFVELANYLSLNKVCAPRILALDEDQGFLLVEDFGDELLYSSLNSDTAEAIYTQAFATLLNVQQCRDNVELIPRYDQTLLHRELLLFSEWFAERLLGHSLSSHENTLLAKMFSALETSAIEQPQTLVHRDFHSRNLILRPDSELGVIDFQGALWGPCTYDLVSLLRDCYIRWPSERVKKWALNYRQLASKLSLFNNISDSEFLRYFDWMGLQRHIKVLGIFARLHLRDGKEHYLRDLPLVIRYTLEVTEQYPEFTAFAEWFKNTLLPLAKQQSWYTDYSIAGENCSSGMNP